MIKKKLLTFLYGLLTLMFFSYALFCAEYANGDFPSEIYWKEGPKGRNARFVLHEQSDLRLLFCNLNVLLDRMKRSVCIVDRVGHTISKQGNQAALVIAIGPGKTVAEVLEKAGIDWRGSQPQLRLITRDAIIQSPLSVNTRDGKPDPSEFLKQKVEPGDFLILATIS